MRLVDRSVALAIAVAFAVAGCSAQAPAAAQTAAPRLEILAPTEGSTVMDRTLTVTGRAPLGAEVERDDGSPQALGAVAVDGTWSMRIELTEGANDLVFRLRGETGTSRALTVFYLPPAGSGSTQLQLRPVSPPAPTVTPGATATATPAPTRVAAATATPAPTAAAVPTATPAASVVPSPTPSLSAAGPRFDGPVVVDA